MTNLDGRTAGALAMVNAHLTRVPKATRSRTARVRAHPRAIRARDDGARASHKSSIFLRRIIGSMFMRVNSKCAHQVRPPLRACWAAAARRPSGARFRRAVRLQANSSDGHAARPYNGVGKPRLGIRSRWSERRSHWHRCARDEGRQDWRPLHIHRSDSFLIRPIRQHHTCDSTSCRRAGAAISLMRGNRP